MVSDGDNNNMIMLAITKVKTTDEGEYRVVVENEHGSDEKSFMLYVSGKNSKIKKVNSIWICLGIDLFALIDEVIRKAICHLSWKQGIKLVAIKNYC